MDVKYAKSVGCGDRNEVLGLVLKVLLGVTLKVTINFQKRNQRLHLKCNFLDHFKVYFGFVFSVR